MTSFIRSILGIRPPPLSDGSNDDCIFPAPPPRGSPPASQSNRDFVVVPLGNPQPPSESSRFVDVGREFPQPVPAPPPEEEKGCPICHDPSKGPLNFNCPNPGGNKHPIHLACIRACFDAAVKNNQDAGVVACPSCREFISLDVIQAAEKREQDAIEQQKQLVRFGIVCGVAVLLYGLWQSCSHPREEEAISLHCYAIDIFPIGGRAIYALFGGIANAIHSFVVQAFDRPPRYESHCYEPYGSGFKGSYPSSQWTSDIYDEFDQQEVFSAQSEDPPAYDFSFWKESRFVMPILLGLFVAAGLVIRSRKKKDVKERQGDEGLSFLLSNREISTPVLLLRNIISKKNASFFASKYGVELLATLFIAEKMLYNQSLEALIKKTRR